MTARASRSSTISWSLIVIAAVLAGCGDSGDSKSSSDKPAKPVSAKAAFTAKLDRICADSNRAGVQFSQEFSAASESSSAKEGFRRLADVMGRSLVVLDRLETRFRALDPPASEQAFYDQFGDSLTETKRLTKQFQRAAEAEDKTKLNVIASSLNATKKARDGLAADHGGFRSCGASPN